MNYLSRISAILLLMTLSANGLQSSQDHIMETIHATILNAISEFDQIPEERQEQLKAVAETLKKRDQGEVSALTFICTHNSRRSHLSQIWAQVASVWYDIPGITTYSGGTESTACNPRTVRALRRAGFSVVDSTPESKNPHYLIQFSEQLAPLTAFSKVYDSEGNPSKDFLAIMTCSHADKNCPIVRGARKRFAIPYTDPKVSDNTPQEDHTYDARLRQIAREMLFLMSQAK
jgi:arsenate reductase